MRFYRIALVRHSKDEAAYEMEQLVYRLCSEKRIECISYDEEDERFKHSRHIPTLFVSVGGDGTMLYTVKESIKFKDATVLGVSAGHLNFLTDKYSAEELSIMLDRIQANDLNLFLDERMLVKGRFNDFPWFYGLNEIMLSPPSLNHMLNYSVDINGKHLADLGGSGILVTTPTGSTAMAMSVGGAIMSPTSRGLQIVPIASHSLTSRPVVVSRADEVTISTKLNERIHSVGVSVDGRPMYAENDEYGTATLEIRAADRTALIWRPDDWNFFDVLREKMRWDK